MIYYKLWSKVEIVLPDGQKMSENPREGPEQADTRKLPSTAQFQAFPLDFKHLFLHREGSSGNFPSTSGLAGFSQKSLFCLKIGIRKPKISLNLIKCDND